MKAEIYQNVTNRIVAMLESGVRPWAQGWNAYAGGGRPLRSDGKPYRGMNVLNLWAAGMARGFSSPYWLTFKKAQELGAKVKKGAKSESAFYASTFKTTEEATGIEKSIPFLKAYAVFNAEEIEGLAPHFYAPAVITKLDPSERIPDVDSFIVNTGADIRYGGGKAFYRPSNDSVHMPEFESFDDAAGFYSVHMHELIHWTGGAKRLDRLEHKVFGDSEYALEELVAELGAAFMCADLGVSSEPREDHASYIAGWLKKLKSDPRAIFSAASAAEKAATFLHATQREESPDADATEAADMALAA